LTFLTLLPGFVFRIANLFFLIAPTRIWFKNLKAIINFKLPDNPSSLDDYCFIEWNFFFSNQSLQERQLYQDVSYETIFRQSYRGIGAGQFILNEHKLHPDLEAWQYQPVHNVYLLIFSELGIVELFYLFSCCFFPIYKFE